MQVRSGLLDSSGYGADEADSEYRAGLRRLSLCPPGYGEGLAAFEERAVELVSPARGASHGGQGGGLRGGIADATREGPEPFRLTVHVLEVADGKEETGTGAVEGDQSREVDGVPQAASRLLRLVVERERLPVGERFGRLVSRFHRIVERSVPRLGLGEMVGEHLV